MERHLQFSNANPWISNFIKVIFLSLKTFFYNFSNILNEFLKKLIFHLWKLIFENSF
jgi:hypothetical protein